MVNVKLIVFFISFSFVLSCARYCEICSEHILCKYTKPGPSASCKRYDNTARLTKNDINEIVNRINDRRNVIAMGLSKHFPQAANMKKIIWSDELATFAQRWVDQCDQSMRPDKEDQCRDLEDANVGQNIASILDPSPNFNLKSFVDIWSMHMLEYFGSVSYYNQSRYHKSYYFTQLIWAESDMVGCGRARFYLHKQNTMVDRVVCNFSPKGNIYGRPIYHIGYPATQCPVNTIPDQEFKGLCKRHHEIKVTKYTSSSPPPRVSSLLRILNLSNNSVKQGIDPVRNDWKHLKSNDNETIEQRYQKTRHVLNNTHGAINHARQFHQQSRRQNNNNSSIQDTHTYNQERGHSRVHHGHDIHKNDYTRQTGTVENSRRYDYITDVISSFNKDYRKYIKNHCTRKIIPKKSEWTTCEEISFKCTRKHKNNDCLQSTKSCEPSRDAYYTNKHILPHEFCPCSAAKPICQTTKCLCNINCKKCLNINCPITSNRPNFRRQEDIIEENTKKSAEFHYYDLLPNVGVHSGDIRNEDKKHYSTSIGHLNINNDDVFVTRLKQQQIKNLNLFNDHGYSTYRPLDFYKRKKREDENFRPFWEVGDFNLKNPALLKSIKYTTLLNKKKKVLRKTGTTIKIHTTTEPITIKTKDVSKIVNKNLKPITEKYLSFDELMHLRKMGITNIPTDARRQANEASNTVETTTATTTTTEVTTNTPFVRKKHCTRKLTCTWTASSPTGADGSIIPGGGMMDRGSRTPPGYVDGCTRTSTCTRDFMDRNRMVTVTEESSGEPVPEDEDYCERKSLYIRKRNSLLKEEETVSKKYAEEFSYLFYSEQTTTEPRTKCSCLNKKSRVKRGQNDNRLHPIAHNALTGKSVSDKLSYGDLYYLVLQKIIGIWKNNKYSKNSDECLCNLVILSRPNIFLILFLYIMYIYFNKNN